MPPVAEVVDVVGLDPQGGLALAELGLPGVQPHEVAQGRDDVLEGERALVQRLLQAQLLVDLVTADLGQVVALGVEVGVLEQLLGGLAGRRLAGRILR